MANPNSLTARAGQAFSRMSEREKRLVLLTGGVAVVLVVLGGVTLLNSALEKRQKQVSARRDEIAQLDAMRDQYQEAVAAEDRSKKRITTNTQSLFSLMQKAAGEVGLSLTDLNEKRTPVKDAPELTQVTVDVNLKEISVDKLDTLIEKIEGRRNDGVVKIDKMKVKTRFDNPEMLELSMTVATWKSSTAATGPAAPGAPPAPAPGATP